MKVYRNADIYPCIFNFLYNKVRDCTVEELKEFTNRFLDASYLQGLVQGNITAAAARQVDDTARRILELKAGLAAEAVTELRCMEVLPGTHYLQAAGFSTGDTNTMVTNYYQGYIFSIVVNIEFVDTILGWEEIKVLTKNSVNIFGKGGGI